MAKRRRLKKKVLKLAISIIFITGYSLSILPFFRYTYDHIIQSTYISSYAKEVDSINSDRIEKIKNDIVSYNETISSYHLNNFYRYSATLKYDDTYLSLPLNTTNEICTIISPKININMMVGHGTSDELLQKEAGHLYGTSLPLPSGSTHSVIAAHSGLRNAEMFSRLDELKLGDKIYVSILNETYVYEVVDINIVLPDECDQYLQVEKDKDLLTLYTCTPYGVNSHRLLVKTSFLSQINNSEDTSEADFIKSYNTKNIIILIVMLLVPLIVLFMINGEKHEKNI